MIIINQIDIDRLGLNLVTGAYKDDAPEAIVFYEALEVERENNIENSMTIDERREKRYNELGALKLDMIILIWEHLVSIENTSVEMDVIEVLRQQCKTNIPKD